jgi:hypothetical protein
MRRRIQPAPLALIPIALTACSRMAVPRRDGPNGDGNGRL